MARTAGVIGSGDWVRTGGGNLTGSSRSGGTGKPSVGCGVAARLLVLELATEGKDTSSSVSKFGEGLRLANRFGEIDGLISDTRDVFVLWNADRELSSGWGVLELPVGCRIAGRLGSASVVGSPTA